MKTNYPVGDIKFYWRIHINRQKAEGLEPVSYSQFYRRICKMSLHDAIYKPKVLYKVTKKSQTPIQDNIRRMQMLKDENVMILDFEQIDKVLTPKQKRKMAKYNMKPKKTLLQKFISYFKSRGQKKESS